jgi:hypothetical protein
MVSFRLLFVGAVAASQGPFLACEAQTQSPSPSPLVNKLATIAPTTYDETLCSSEYLAYSDCMLSLPNGTYNDCAPCIYQYISSTVDFSYINRTASCAEFDKAFCTYAVECQNTCPCIAETMIVESCIFANCYNYVSANNETCASDGNCQPFSCLPGLPAPVSKAPSAPSTPSAAPTSPPPSLQTASPASSPLPPPKPTGERPCADERSAHASCLASTGNASACKGCMSARFHGNYSLCNENLQYVCGAPQACSMCEACQGTLVAITNCYVAAVGVCAPVSCRSSPSQSPGAGPATSSPAGVPTITSPTTGPTYVTFEPTAEVATPTPSAYPTAANSATPEPTIAVATLDPTSQLTAYPTANFPTSEPTFAVATPDPTSGGFPGVPVPTPSANTGPRPLPGMSPTPNSPPSANPGPRPLPGMSPTPNSPPSSFFLSGGARADSFDVRWLIARAVGILVVAQALV